GDAAGFYDPFTGEGIFTALRSAELAADTLVTALRADDVSAAALAAYGRARRAAFADKERVTRALQALIGRRRLANLAARWLAARARRHAAKVPGHAWRGAGRLGAGAGRQRPGGRALRRAVGGVVPWAEGPRRRDRRQHARRRFHRAHPLSDLRALSQSSRFGAALARDRLGPAPDGRRRAREPRRPRGG